LTLNDELGVIPYEPSSFEARYLYLDSSLIRTFKGFYDAYGAVDSLAGFNFARPAFDGLPPLNFDTTRNCLKQLMGSLFDTRHCLPHTPAFAPGHQAEVIYEYGSRYPETSELAGLPCGLLCRHDESRSYAFSFHLWGMNHADARELIAYLLTVPPQPNPPPLPETFHLSQNYPNPFNQTTTIAFSLARPSQVLLEVFNILGQRVQTVTDDYREAGPHTETWDGRGADGVEVASGVYLYRLSAGRQVATRKMVLIR
jgi:hypothetical protein